MKIQIIDQDNGNQIIPECNEFKISKYNPPRYIKAPLNSLVIECKFLNEYENTDFINELKWKINEFKGKCFLTIINDKKSYDCFAITFIGEGWNHLIAIGNQNEHRTIT